LDEIIEEVYETYGNSDDDDQDEEVKSEQTIESRQHRRFNSEARP